VELLAWARRPGPAVWPNCKKTSRAQRGRPTILPRRRDPCVAFALRILLWLNGPCAIAGNRLAGTSRNCSWICSSTGESAGARRPFTRGAPRNRPRLPSRSKRRFSPRAQRGNEGPSWPRIRRAATRPAGRGTCLAETQEGPTPHSTWSVVGVEYGPRPKRRDCLERLHLRDPRRGKTANRLLTVGKGLLRAHRWSKSPSSPNIFLRPHGPESPTVVTGARRARTRFWRSRSIRFSPGRAIEKWFRSCGSHVIGAHPHRQNSRRNPTTLETWPPASRPEVFAPTTSNVRRLSYPPPSPRPTSRRLPSRHDLRR